MVPLAQSVERLIVVQEVMGSIPIRHPTIQFLNLNAIELAFCHVTFVR